MSNTSNELFKNATFEGLGKSTAIQNAVKKLLINTFKNAEERHFEKTLTAPNLIQALQLLSRNNKLTDDQLCGLGIMTFASSLSKKDTDYLIDLEIEFEAHLSRNDMRKGFSLFNFYSSSPLVLDRFKELNMVANIQGENLFNEDGGNQNIHIELNKTYLIDHFSSFDDTHTVKYGSITLDREVFINFMKKVLFASHY